MRARTVVALVALAVVDLLVVVLGYRAYNGSLPPFQRATTTFEVTGSATAEPTEAPVETAIVAPLLLAVNPAGDVLRATRGSCEEFRQRPAHAWVGSVNDDAAPSPVEVPGVREVLGLMVYADGTMRITGLDESCQSLTVDSKDGGTTWQGKLVAGIWRLAPDTTATSVLGPAGSVVDTPCVPNQILNLPGKQAIGSCATGTFFTLVPGETAGGLSAGSFTQLSVAPGIAEGRFFAFGATDDCGARVAEVKTVDQSVKVLACLDGNRAPMAIASTADLLVVQVGADLMVSRDGGESFSSVGPESEPSPSSTAS